MFRRLSRDIKPFILSSGNHANASGLSEFINLVWRGLSSQSHAKKNPHIALVGGGPAGYYTAQQLLKGNPNIVVDIYEKLPVPFGLVRFGVAPDHPEVKNVIHSFSLTAMNERCHFFGNIEVGKDVSLQSLRDSYTAVVLCYGAADDRLLEIPGENLPNVLSARSFVGWYNGIPEDKNLSVNLDCESAVVLGHGNVALDVARILLTPVSILEKTDITEHSLEILRKSKIKKVHLVGRRGPLQVAFTIKELREMVNLADTRTVIQPSDVQGLDKIIEDIPRPRRRLTELMFKSAVEPSAETVQRWAQACREWRLVFLRSPVEICHSSTGEVQGVKFIVNKLQGDNPETQKAVPTDTFETISCGLVLRSIGYKCLPLDNTLPFDVNKGVLQHKQSRIEKHQGLYCTGWAANGPVGVILGTMSDAFETGKVVLQDIDNGSLQCLDASKRDNLLAYLQDRAVTFSDWLKIDKAECLAGEAVGKPREKLTDIEQMLSIARSGR
ncbi:hypothetical protein Btru_018876 [Bulinus truncatus]|nr:hypothetical protein Btru_018876 [Bulinus truncatus]